MAVAACWTDGMGFEADWVRSERAAPKAQPVMALWYERSDPTDLTYRDTHPAREYRDPMKEQPEDGPGAEPKDHGQ
jgi:hypothetical protein